MREYKFRGKSKQYGHFVYGTLIDCGCLKKILTVSELQVPVEKQTVSQFIGLTDKNEIDIYEGDIVKANGMYPSLIIFENGSFRFKGGQESIVDDWNHYSEFEVIGNIIDNPELDSY